MSAELSWWENASTLALIQCGRKKGAPHYVVTAQSIISITWSSIPIKLLPSASAVEKLVSPRHCEDIALFLALLFNDIHWMTKMSFRYPRLFGRY